MSEDKIVQIVVENRVQPFILIEFIVVGYEVHGIVQDKSGKLSKHPIEDITVVNAGKSDEILAEIVKEYKF